MISFIKGEAVDFGENTVIVDNGGIGYELTVSNTTITKIKSGSPYICLYSYMAVREDGISLYGFFSKEERTMFLKLITISGVGPKAAIGILSGIEIYDLMRAIMASDIKTLSKLKGVGKKTAERIVLELRGEIDADSKELMESLPVSTDDSEAIDNDMADAISALRGLGFTQSEATDAVKKAKQHVKKAEELVAYALRNLY